MKYIPLVLLFLVACPGVNQKPTPLPIDTNYCRAADSNIESLQCKDRRGDPMWINKKGEKFEDTCVRAQTEGFIFLNPKCVSTATTCDQVKHCTQQ